jgi:hypothetical protein
VEFAGENALIHVPLRLRSAAGELAQARVDLVTPTSNIAEFRRYRQGQGSSFNGLVGDIALIGLGALAGGLGYSLVSDAASHNKGAGNYAAGIALMAGGVGIAAMGVYLMIPESEVDEPLWPRAGDRGELAGKRQAAR